MSGHISFRQHIRTSSKVRRGFRTYQLTPPIDEATDEKLGAYSEYSATTFTGALMQRADFPVLFIYYQLTPQIKVLCKSVYIGLDLHSYPPRSGNYLSHCLLYDGNMPFNPAEIYEKARWKTPEDIALADNGGVPFDIDKLAVETDSGFLETKWFEILTLLPEAKKRGQMLKIAVDAIIKGKKLIIVDEKGMLLHWTMTLLQVFPELFVYNKLTISSFANSNLLVNVCSVLCCEQDGAEKVKRYAKDAVIVDFYAVNESKASVYAEVLLDRILLDDFVAFSTKIFPKISVNSRYLPEDFNRPALFYDQLRKINEEMSAADFITFFTLFMGDQEAIDEIFQEIKRKSLAHLCPLMWKSFTKNKPLVPADLTYYKYIYHYRIPGITDESWLHFEAGSALALPFKEVKEVNNFFQVTGGEMHGDRKICYYDVMSKVIREHCLTGDAIALGTESLRRVLGELSEVQTMAIQEMDVFGEIMTEISRAVIEEKYRLALEYIPILIEWQRSSLIKSLPPLGWEILFVTDRALLSKFYSVPEFKGLLPWAELARLVYESTYPEQEGRLNELYQQLPITQQELFLAHATKSLQELIIFKQPGLSLNKPEEILLRYIGVIPHSRLIAILIDRAQRHSSLVVLWKLVSIVFEPDKFRSKYPGITDKLRAADLDQIFPLLDDISNEIPPGFEKLAAMLSDKKMIKRDVPRSELFAVLNAQRTDIRTALGKGKFDKNVLAELISLPWLYYSWEQLFGELDHEQQEQLPGIIGELAKTVSHNPQGYMGYHPVRWNAIICQYFVFLLVYDKYAHFSRLTQKVAITWEEYDQITQMLWVLASAKENDAMKMFIEGNRAISRGMTKGPEWRSGYG